MAEFKVVPLSKTLLVEGGARRDAFRGMVLAVGWWEGGSGAGAGAPRTAGWGGTRGAPEMHYLVSDQSKPAPIWVEGRQVTSQRWFPVLAPGAESGRGEAVQ